ncbi:uncharacterized protein M6B38_129260 [Iris pallida]|uniref:Uncharacterized protein n=1 Tax=Iris pallida TaxID=29817 RepID=A0AAX6G613_IRIPA|nr:uncharacterized protein M6B38_129260 [Iris pallida]
MPRRTAATACSAPPTGTTTADGASDPSLARKTCGPPPTSRCGRSGPPGPRRSGQVDDEDDGVRRQLGGLSLAFENIGDGGVCTGATRRGTSRLPPRQSTCPPTGPGWAGPARTTQSTARPARRSGSRRTSTWPGSTGGA